MTLRPILHHYPASPFSEKVRLALGLKGLTYGSVRIPAIMPKPDVTALTGGYRKTPVLQLGSHVFCDTACILPVLDVLCPSPPLFAHPASECVAQWADGPLFDVAVALSTHPSTFDRIVELMTRKELEGFIPDRQAMRQGARRQVMRFKTGSVQLPVYLQRVGRMVAQGPYVLGAAPGAADLAIYHNLWLIDMLNPERLPSGGPVREWMARIEAIGHGTPEPCDAQTAISTCRDHDGSEWPTPEHAALDHVQPGQRVGVRADDWGCDEVEGELLASDPTELVIRRKDPRAGVVTLHFPRVGFEIRGLD